MPAFHVPLPVADLSEAAGFFGHRLSLHLVDGCEPRGRTCLAAVGR